MHSFNEPNVPSTRHPFSLKCVNISWNRCCLFKTFGLPMTISPLRARVMATFKRLGSLKNPIPDFSFERTQVIIMKSFSFPWNESTLAT